MSKTYEYSDNTQLSPHFNISEFRCKCGKEHETLNNPELIEKLEKLFTALNCSKIIVTSSYRCTAHPDKEHQPFFPKPCEHHALCGSP